MGQAVLGLTAAMGKYFGAEVICLRKEVPETTLAWLTDSLFWQEALCAGIRNRKPTTRDAPQRLVYTRMPRREQSCSGVSQKVACSLRDTANAEKSAQAPGAPKSTSCSPSALTYARQLCTSMGLCMQAVLQGVGSCGVLDRRVSTVFDVRMLASNAFSGVTDGMSSAGINHCCEGRSLVHSRVGVFQNDSTNLQHQKQRKLTKLAL